MKTSRSRTSILYYSWCQCCGAVIATAVKFSQTARSFTIIKKSGWLTDQTEEG